MVKTLATLAVSMTAGGVLLAWMEPRPAEVVAARDGYGLGPFQLAARQAIGAAQDIKPGRWSAVEVVALAEVSPGSRHTLVATAPPDDFHFLVMREGDLQTLAPWRHQQAAVHGSRAIRIGVVGAPTDGTIPPAQWGALRALLVELAELAGPLTVRVADALNASLADGRPTHAYLSALLADQAFGG